MTTPSAPTVGVIIPIRSFAGAFTRLQAALPPDDRAALARNLAERAVDAAGDLPVTVVSSDPEVVAWADTHGLAVIDDPGSLSSAAEAGRRYWADAGANRVVVLHADLPRIRSITAVVGAPEPVVIVACHRRDGTPVLAVPAAAPFPFAYGPGSFAAHCAAARTSGLLYRVIEDPALSTDIDVPEDLSWLAAFHADGS